MARCARMSILSLCECVKVESRQGKPIATLEDWRVLGGPASAGHWVSGRSARCLAEAWIEGDALQKLVALLSKDPSGKLAGFEPQRAIAEAQTAFDRYQGGKRNHDLLVIGDCDGGRTIVGVEGKADETFGPTLREFVHAAESRAASGERTNAAARLQGLVAALSPSEIDPAELSYLRYQLFSGVAGTLAAAMEHGATQAVFCVEEFVTDVTDPSKQDTNARALRRFVCKGPGREPSDGYEWLIGPLRVPGSELIPGYIPLWVSHLRTSMH